MESEYKEKVNLSKEKRNSIRDTSDVSIYIEKIDGKRVFVKEAISENSVSIIKREFHNQNFFRTLAQSKDLGFEFLRPTLDGKKLIYPDITEIADWLAIDETPERQMVPLQEYLPTTTKFIRACLEVQYSDLPSELKLDAEQRKSNVQGKLEQFGKYLFEKKLLKEAAIQKLMKKVTAGASNRAFQHHDIVPWHMAKKHSDGGLILVDSGWSGCSFKYYDIAYYILQMVGYAERPEEARGFLNTMKEEFQNDPNFKESLAVPLSYRGMRLATELDQQGKSKNAKEVLSMVFSEI